MKRLVPSSTVVVVVDVQERLAQAMPPGRVADVVRAVRLLAAGAQRLGGTVLVTQQYTSGLGATLAVLDDGLAHAERFEKVTFSAVGAAGFVDALARTRATSAVVVGMETHVCVYQTVRDLVARDLDVHVALDGVSSRDEQHRETGLRLCERAGASVTTAETVVFDWLERAGTEDFKVLARLVK